MIFNSTFGVKGRYKAIVRGPDMSVRRESEWSDNVVTNRGVQELMSASAGGEVNLRCCCGSGNVTPSVTDVSLASFVAGTAAVKQNDTVTRNYTVAPFYVMHSMGWRFGAGVAAGNISELGVAIGSSAPTSSTPLFSRALVRDAGGNPTTITVESDEYLDVYYELYIYPPSESTGTFNQMIDGSPVSFTYTQRPSGMSLLPSWPQTTATAIFGVAAWASAGNNYSGVFPSGGSLGDASSLPSGAISRFRTASSSAYSPSTKSRDLTYTAELGDANMTFDMLTLSYTLGSTKLQISPPITKVNTKTYTITIRVTLDNTI